ncbi:MAG: hypothetical protein KGP28_07090 [Bdellovibrionales bacterium]|nr:hypothetical protein [Bdellovibrionales bacterium]
MNFTRSSDIQSQLVVGGGNQITAISILLNLAKRATEEMDLGTPAATREPNRAFGRATATIFDPNEKLSCVVNFVSSFGYEVLKTNEFSVGSFGLI